MEPMGSVLSCGLRVIVRSSVGFVLFQALCSIYGVSQSFEGFTRALQTPVCRGEGFHSTETGPQSLGTRLRARGPPYSSYRGLRALG